MLKHAEKEYDELRFGDEEAWLGARNKFVGSSEVAALYGLGYASQSPYAIWLQKTQGVRIPIDADQLKVMNIGKMAEPLIRAVWEQEDGRPIQFDTVPVVRRSRRFPCIGATIDGWVEGDDGPEVTELKFIGVHQRSEFKDTIPHKYTIQIQHQLACTGWDRGWLYAMCANETFRYEVPRHEGIIEQIVNRCEWFMDLCERNIAPPVDGTEATAAAILAQFPVPEPKEVIELPSDFEAIGERLELVKEDLKKLEEEHRELTSKVKAAIGTAEIAYTSAGGYAWHWRKQGKSRALYPTKVDRFEILKHKVRK